MTILRPLIALACLGLTSAGAQQRSQRPLDGLDAYVAKAMADWRVPGLAIVVVKDTSVVFIRGYGVRELGKPDPVTVHTRFGNMSTTKAFTAMLVAMLADSGTVAFDDPVQKYEPQVLFADPYVTREITVRDLLTHRVGRASARASSTTTSPTRSQAMSPRAPPARPGSRCSTPESWGRSA